jgi:hypothetical protein
MDGASIGVFVSIVAAFGWALVRRVRRARRVFPRARFRLQLSLRTPESDPPPETEPVSDDERPTNPPSGRGSRVPPLPKKSDTGREPG